MLRSSVLLEKVLNSGLTFMDCGNYSGSYDSATDQIPPKARNGLWTKVVRTDAEDAQENPLYPDASIACDSDAGSHDRPDTQISDAKIHNGELRKVVASGIPRHAKVGYGESTESVCFFRFS